MFGKWGGNVQYAFQHQQHLFGKNKKKKIFLSDGWGPACFWRALVRGSRGCGLHVGKRKDLQERRAVASLRSGLWGGRPGCSVAPVMLALGSLH